MDFFSDDNKELTPALATSKKQDKNDYDGQLTVDVYQTDNDIVTIKGRRPSPEKVRPSDYYYQELFWGPFSRSIILPEDIDSDNAKASMKNGLLTIRLPKLSKK